MVIIRRSGLGIFTIGWTKVTSTAALVPLARFNFFFPSIKDLVLLKRDESFTFYCSLIVVNNFVLHFDCSSAFNP